VELLPERCLYWPERGLLAAADLHWGKPESFQQHGIPLPAGVLKDDLERLSRALRRGPPVLGGGPVAPALLPPGHRRRHTPRVQRLHRGSGYDSPPG
jgi:hypothetical protein